MVNFIYTAREHHNIKDADTYAAAQAAILARRATRGNRTRAHEVATRLPARIDCNTWLVDCECGAGNAIDPAWPVAHCFGCGAIHRHIEVPPLEMRTAIEAALLRRLFPRQRSWSPGETLADLERENAGLPPDQLAPLDGASA